MNDIRRHRSTPLALLAGVLLSCTLAACGGSEVSAGSKSEGSGSSSTTTDAKGNAWYEWQLKQAKCLRSKGIDVADPDPVKGADPNVVQDDAFKKALSACGDTIGPPPVDDAGGSDEKFQAALKAAKCLRSLGYEVPDPARGDGLQIGNQKLSDEAVGKCMSK